jgi:hypothetical protein
MIPLSVVVAHVADWPEDRPATGEEWEVWNAPRPLVGEQEWTGDFRHGIFYAAARRKSERFGYYGVANFRDDARTVVVVDNATVEAETARRIAERGYTLADYTDAGYTLADAADENGLPWRDGVG